MTVELLSVADVARITGLSETTIRAAIADGELAATRLRRRIRIAVDDVAAWIDENRVRPPLASELILGDARPTAPPRLPVPPGGFREAARQMRKAA